MTKTADCSDSGRQTASSGRSLCSRRRLPATTGHARPSTASGPSCARGGGPGACAPSPGLPKRPHARSAIRPPRPLPVPRVVLRRRPTSTHWPPLTSRSTPLDLRSTRRGLVSWRRARTSGSATRRSDGRSSTPRRQFASSYDGCRLAAPVAADWTRCTTSSIQPSAADRRVTRGLPGVQPVAGFRRVRAMPDNRDARLVGDRTGPLERDGSRPGQGRPQAGPEDRPRLRRPALRNDDETSWTFRSDTTAHPGPPPLLQVDHAAPADAHSVAGTAPRPCVGLTVRTENGLAAPRRGEAEDRDVLRRGQDVERRVHGRKSDGRFTVLIAPWPRTPTPPAAACAGCRPCKRSAGRRLAVGAPGLGIRHRRR